MLIAIDPCRHAYCRPFLTFTSCGGSEMIFFLSSLHVYMIDQLRVMVKMYWGDPREKVCDAVGELNLESLVMGSRGLGQIQRYATLQQELH